MRGDKRTSLKSEAKGTVRGHKRGVTGYSRKTALLEEAITQMNAGKYGRSSSALKELLALDPQNMEARRLFATLHLRLGSLIPARQAFDTLITEAFQRQDYWLAESLLREYLAAGPRCVPFLEKLGLIYQEKGDVQEAIAEYGKAIDILIEDPDPDNPHLVSQLYQKVRELAPASPIAIRLASFFDAQTGELIARGPSHSEPAPELLDTTSDHPAIPEPASGVMPWEIDIAQGDRHVSSDTITQPDGSSGLAPTQDREALSDAVAAHAQAEPLGEVPIHVQSDRSPGEGTPSRSPEVIHQATDHETLLAHKENRAPVHGSSPEAQLIFCEPAASTREDHPRVAQGTAESTEESAAAGNVCTTESSAVQQTTSVQPSAASGVTALTQETASAAVIQNQAASSHLSEAVSTVPDRAVGAPTDTSRDRPASEGSRQVSPQAPAEPWKEPGFSWENLFDRAWNFGTLPSADSAPQDVTPSKRDAPSTSDSSPPPSSSIESESVHIPERVENTAFMDEATSTGSVRPLPWDQIQESVLPIPPARVEGFQGEGVATTEGQSDHIGEDTASIEGAAVENSARTDRDAIAAELTSTASVSPLPWDQIQESVLPIPPASVGVFHGEGTTTTEGQSDHIGEDTTSIENATVEIPERTDRDGIAVELTDTGSVRPLPWDQVQESVLLILPAEVKESHGDGGATTNGESVATVQDTPQAEHESVEIAESVARDAAVVELTTAAPVSQLPGDQIQESALPIPQGVREELQGEGVAIIEGQASSTGEDTASIENATVEIPERTDRGGIGVELTDTGSVRSLPWDQIQESALTIPPAQVDEFRGEAAATTEGQSGAIGESKPSIESAAVESPESAGQDLAGEEGLTATDPLTPQACDKIEESILPIPTVPIEEFQAEGTATAAERGASIVGADGVANVVQDHLRTGEASAPAPDAAKLLSERTSSGTSSPSEADVPSDQVHHSEQETLRPEISPAVSATASRANEEDPQAGEAGSTAPASLAQTDELDQSFRLRVHDARALEQEAAGSQSPQTGEARPISEPEQALPSTSNESDTVETSQVGSLLLVEERRTEREESTVVSQHVATEEYGAVSSVLRDSQSPVPRWGMPESVTVPSAEPEVITAAPVETFSSSSSAALAATVQSHDDLRQDGLTLTESALKNSESTVPQEEWAKTSESIRFVEEPPKVSAVTAESEPMGVAPTLGTVADDTRFMSSRNVGRDASRAQEVEPPSRPKVRSESRGIGVVIQDFIGSCFSTTRAIVATGVGLILLGVIAVAAGIGMISLTWLSMEEGPTPAYQRFTTIPQQTLSDVKRNGYFLLVGFDASAQLDPIQAGYEGKIGTDQVATGLACLGDTQGPSRQQSNASASVSKSWFRGADPIGQFKSHADTVRGWATQQSVALSRYGQWHTLPFEDWGYGQTGHLPCESIVFAHELYLADGFLQAMEEGVGRLETDMEAWRIVLGQARTLPVKALALQAMNDDIAVASGLLNRSDFDGKYLGRLSKMLRPLDQAELSIRWPMQSELVVASKTYEAQVKAAKAGDQSVYAVIASTLSLPKQRRLNDYAEYYEASYKAVGEGHHSTLPKWKDYMRTPAAGLSDYLANPIENIVGLEVLPPWDLYHGQVMDTEARLRLASLQAWLRRGPTDGDVLTRLAKAGQKFYDPYTGLPMLVNMKKAALYSVGHDGKDQDADPQFDVVVTIPAIQAPSSQVSSKSAAESSKP